VPPPQDSLAHADIVVLDDAGNGFRDQPALWPLAIQGDQQPIIVYKVRRPLFGENNDLWKILQARHLPRTIAILNADELRAEGAAISRRLSWERTAADLVLALAHDARFRSLKRCAHLIVPLGLEGVVHLHRKGIAVKTPQGKETRIFRGKARMKRACGMCRI
jgi:hypothetical protein